MKLTRAIVGQLYGRNQGRFIEMDGLTARLWVRVLYPFIAVIGSKRKIWFSWLMLTLRSYSLFLLLGLFFSPDGSLVSASGLVYTDAGEEKVPAMGDLSQPATKEDIQGVKADIINQLSSAIHSATQGMEQLDLVTKADIEQLRSATQTDIEQLRSATQVDIERLDLATKNNIKEAQIELLLWIIGIIIAQSSVIIAAIKLTP